MVDAKSWLARHFLGIFLLLRPLKWVVLSQLGSNWRTPLSWPIFISMMWSLKNRGHWKRMSIFVGKLLSTLCSYRATQCPYIISMILIFTILFKKLMCFHFYVQSTDVGDCISCKQPYFSERSQILLSILFISAYGWHIWAHLNY